jgi:oligoendopeptidase F
MDNFSLPVSVDAIDPQKWATFEPYFAALLSRDLTAENSRQWLMDWSGLLCLLWESISLTFISKSLDTANQAYEQAFLTVVEEIIPQAESANQALKEKLLTLDHSQPAFADMQLVLRQMQTESALFRVENSELQTAVAKLDNEYEKITGSMLASWDGEEKNLTQLAALLKNPDRAIRERAFAMMSGLWLQHRETLNDIYSQMVKLRHQIAINAGLADYRAYAFLSYGRFEYTPEDCLAFHDAIEAIAVPATRRILAKRRERLNGDAIRPWDWIPEKSLLIEADQLPPLAPFQGQDALIQGSLNIFHQLDPQLGRYLANMAEEQLLDLDTRPGKALGGYCSTLHLRRRPFIFMNSTGNHDDVQTMLHEAGHAFHVYEAAHLPLIWQTEAPMEFCEVASMSMELLAAPNLVQDKGGFYTASQAAKAQIEHLENIITFLPYMAVVDAFQHWVYTHPEQAQNPENCDQTWDTLWQRFIPDLDWTGYENSRQTGWHRKLHIFGNPFYYIEYGIAQVGALQIWRNSQQNHADALRTYRQALSLGGTQTLPQLFHAADVQFRFDTPLLKELVDLVEYTIHQLEHKLA